MFGGEPKGTNRPVTGLGAFIVTVACLAGMVCFAVGFGLGLLF